MTPHEPEKETIQAARRRPSEAPAHPKLAAALLMIGIVVALFLVALLSAIGW
jgi:hypothetical protein